MIDGLLLLNLVSAAYFTGLIWFVQVVHYPLFESVGEAGWSVYHRRHTSRTTWIVAPVMLTEAAASVALVAVWASWAAWVALGLTAVTWLSTFAAQVPRHNRLSSGPDVTTIRRLVRGNWIRTACWTARLALLTAVVLHRLFIGR